MKILILTYSFLPDVGGTEIVAYDYATLLVEKGHDVSVVSKAYPGYKNTFPFKHFQVPNFFGNSLWILNFGLYLRKLKLKNYDCIILNQCHTPLIAGRFFNKKTFSKTITLIQGLEVESIYTYTKSFWGKLICGILRHDYYHKRCLMNCRKVVSVSEFHKNKVIKAANIADCSSKFEVIYTGIDKNVFKRVSSDFKIKHSWDKKELLISVSRIEKMKGYDNMLDIFKRLLSVNNNFIWIIIGDGPYFNTLSQKIIEYSLQNNVVLQGKVNRDNLRYYYSAADCFWLLSNYDECLPLVYLEAQACGVPVIGRNKGGVVETIVNNKTGFLVNNDMECLEILINKRYKNISIEEQTIFLDRFDKNEASERILK